jgi:hypothetical protein
VTHDHNHLEQLPGDTEDPRGAPVWTFGLVGGVLFAVTLLGVTAFFYAELEDELDVKLIDISTTYAQTARLAENDPMLDALRWEHWEVATKDPSPPRLVVPIAVGMEQVIATWGAGAKTTAP